MLLPNADGSGRAIEVHPPLSCNFAPTQAGEGGEEHQGAKALRHQVCQFEHLCHSEDRPFLRLFFACSPGCGTGCAG